MPSLLGIIIPKCPQFMVCVFVRIQPLTGHMTTVLLYLTACFLNFDYPLLSCFARTYLVTAYAVFVAYGLFGQLDARFSAHF